jgi:REP-associated tyrosine transposase
MIKGKPPRLGQIYIDQPLYFVTCCTLSPTAFAREREHSRNISTYCSRAGNHNIGVGQYVPMPDHVHLFVRGDMKFDLGVWIRGLKRAVSRERDFWQPGFFDHILRSDESYSEKWNYIRENPVRAGLVAADGWPFQGEIMLIDRA